MSSAPSRSSTQSLDAALDLAVSSILRALVDVASANPTVIVDGRSGAGKTSLVARLVARWPHGAVQMVALDAVYPGWEGLAEGAEYAREHVLAPHARGVIGVWRRWDWERDERAEAYAVDPSLPLIVEGAGMLTPAASALADVRVWVRAPDPVRRTRALARDGDTFRPYWDMWAAQENEHLAAHAPESLASLVVTLP